MIEKKEFCKYCPFHNDVDLIHTELQDGVSTECYPECQELFGEKYIFMRGCASHFNTY